MGCDIHVYILHKTDNGYEELCFYDKNGEKIQEWHYPYCDRNYVLFGILAGVRVSPTNGVLAEPRGVFEGLPRDLLDEYNGYNCPEDDEWYGTCCYHTPTWYDITELMAYAFTDKAKDYGYHTEDMVNFLSPWIDSLFFMLESHSIYYPKPGDVIVQIWFDN